MLKRRLILALTINDGQLCRTKNFKPDYTYSPDFVDLSGADELVVIDVSSSGGERAKFLGVVEKLSQELFLPLAVGGHVHDWDYARDLMNAGADKIVLGYSALATEAEVPALARRLGRQSVTVGVDLNGPGHDMAAAIARSAQIQGAGEILLQSVERDGSLLGYDCGLVKAVSDAVSIPVIAMSGCGTPQHMIEAFNAGAAACATSNIFQFLPQHVRRFRKVIQDAGIAMRPV